MLLEFNIEDYTIVHSGNKSIFELGKEYAITFDNDYILNSTLRSYPVFKLKKNGSDIYADDETMFSNAADSHEPVLCVQTFSQVKTKLCSLVHFKFIPQDMYLKGTYEHRIYRDTQIKHRIYVDDIGIEPVKCDHHIITDDVHNVNRMALIDESIDASDATLNNTDAPTTPVETLNVVVEPDTPDAQNASK